MAQTDNWMEFASELRRIYTIGRLTPHIWMQEAVGSDVSVDPLLDAVEEIMAREQAEKGKPNPVD